MHKAQNRNIFLESRSFEDLAACHRRSNLHDIEESQNYYKHKVSLIRVLQHLLNDDYIVIHKILLSVNTQQLLYLKLLIILTIGTLSNQLTVFNPLLMGCMLLCYQITGHAKNNAMLVVLRKHLYKIFRNNTPK